MRLCFWKSKFRIDALVGPAGSWYWKLISAKNGETLAVSETYSSMSACVETAMKVADALKCPCRSKYSVEGDTTTWIIHRE